MDAVIEWISCSSILLAVISTIIIGILSFKSSSSRINLPPGNLGLPVIGETLQFYRAQKRNRLFEDFFGNRIQKYGSVFKTGLMGSPTVVFTGAAGNRFLLSNEFKLVVSSWPQCTVNLIGRGSIMEKHGAEHKRLRGAVMACLRAEVLQSFVGKLSSVIEDHFERHWKGNHVVLVYPLTKLLTFTSVCSLFLGFEGEAETKYLSIHTTFKFGLREKEKDDKRDGILQRTFWILLYKRKNG